MRQIAGASIVALTLLASACGGISIADDGNRPHPDAAPAPSPFVPAAIENVIEALVGAITTKNIAAVTKPPVAVLLKDLTGFWAPVVVGSNRMIARLALPAVVQAPLIPDQSVSEDIKGTEQNTYIQSYLTGAIYQAMAVAPFSTNAESVQYLNSFVTQRGPAVTLDSDSPTSARSYLIATANFQAGATAANTLRSFMNAGDTVAVFGTTDPSWASGMERANGAEAAAAAAGLTLAPRIPVVWSDVTDQATILAAISDPALNIKGLLCMYSNSYLCAAAVEAAGKKGAVQIVGFDMETDTKTYFDLGYFAGIAVQRQYYMGELGVLVPYSLATLGPTKTAALLQPILVDGFLIDTGIDIITTANYADYMAYLGLLGIYS
jgi:ribose transport system substrate-binding protein